MTGTILTFVKIKNFCLVLPFQKILSEIARKDQPSLTSALSLQNLGA